jgi:hypothetical protein
MPDMSPLPARSPPRLHEFRYNLFSLQIWGQKCLDSFETPLQVRRELLLTPFRTALMTIVEALVLRALLVVLLVLSVRSLAGPVVTGLSLATPRTMIAMFLIRHRSMVSPLVSFETVLHRR